MNLETPHEPPVDVPAKPRVLIADDSRIVRAALIKRIEGMFEFREALDGEQAWEALLLDPSIRVVITDLTMPKLDGYGLLQRIRASRIRRIREMPVVVVSGSDDQDERDRARAAGATDLITKGIGTGQLLSRLDVLSNLVITQQEFERGLEALVRATTVSDSASLASADILWEQARNLLSSAQKQQRNFVILNVCLGIRHRALHGGAMPPPMVVVEAVGRLLRNAVRKTDLMARTGEAEFALVTGSVNFDSARSFANRICRAIADASMVGDDSMSFIASCGVAALCDADIDPDATTLDQLRERAHKRALHGLNLGLTGVIGQPEQHAFECGERAVATSAHVAAETPDLATLLKWMREGRQDDVVPHLSRLATELEPLVALLPRRTEH